MLILIGISADFDPVHKGHEKLIKEARKLADNENKKVVVYLNKGFSANLPINLKNWTDVSGWVKPYKPHVIKSGTGAGDTSIAAFIATVLEGMSIKDCVRYAAAEGACCLEGYDALSSIRTIPELSKMFLMGQ